MKCKCQNDIRNPGALLLLLTRFAKICKRTVQWCIPTKFMKYVWRRQNALDTCIYLFCTWSVKAGRGFPFTLFRATGVLVGCFRFWFSKIQYEHILFSFDVVWENKRWNERRAVDCWQDNSAIFSNKRTQTFKYVLWIRGVLVWRVKGEEGMHIDVNTYPTQQTCEGDIFYETMNVNKR